MTATLGDLQAHTDVTVAQVPDSIAVEPSELAFSALGDTATLTATVIDTDGAAIVNAEVEWSSDDPAVATVSSEGMVVAVGTGERIGNRRLWGLSGSGRHNGNSGSARYLSASQ